MAKAIFDNKRAVEGVFCPECDCWMDDIYGQPDKCPKCGVTLDGWEFAKEARDE